MIETRVRVQRIADGMAWVEPTEQNGCGACQASSACAVSGLGRFFSRRRQPIAIRAGHACAGDLLTLGMGESDFLKVGLLAYLLPTILALAGALAGSVGGDLPAVLGMALGFSLGLLLAKLLSDRVAPPMAMGVLPEPIPSNQGETS